MAAELRRVDPYHRGHGERACGRCSDEMEAVELRSGALVWRCPTCKQLEI